jgi:hypothetical protein
MVATLEPNSTVVAAELMRDMPLSEDAAPLLASARNPRDLIDKLLAAGLASDAVRVLLRALPKRYAIAFVCDCVRKDAGIKPLAAADAACLEIAEAWLVDDSDAKRREAAARAEAAGRATPSAWAAAAAGWSGGSLAPRGYTEVPPPAHLYAVACFAALMTLAAADPKQSKATLAALVNRACASFGARRA